MDNMTYVIRSPIVPSHPPRIISNHKTLQEMPRTKCWMLYEVRDKSHTPLASHIIHIAEDSTRRKLSF